MKYTMKKTLAFLLTLVMLVNIFPLSAFAGLQNSGSSVTTAAPAEQPDETKDAEETPRGSRKKKA